jgi:hypothetical protein
MPQDEKLWLQRDVQKVAEAAAKAAIQSTGRALPCRVTALNPTNPATGEALGYSWVTVQFEANLPYTQADGTTAYYQLPPLTLPKAESQWLRAPTQVGDFGITQPADTYLGAVTGLGSGVADTGTDYGNLSTLVWLPVGSATFAAAPDPNKTWINGPAGAVTSDTAQTAVTTHATNTITHAAGSGADAVGSTYNGTNAQIQHTAGTGANQVYTLYDGTGKAISHVGPTGLGAVYSTLPSTRAVPAQADLTTLSNNLISTSLQRMSTAIGAASVSAGMTGAAAFNAILSASGFITGLSGINPTIPNCSSIVRVST